MKSQKGFAPIILILIAVVFLAAIGGAFYLIILKKQYTEEVVTNNTQTTPSATSGPTATDSAAPAAKMGTVSGKLCYPSDGIPPGKIVAKSITSGKIYTQDYAGTGAGGGTNYSFSLPVDSYNLRLELGSSPGSSGYHTTVCPTGGETTCGETQKRELISANLNQNQIVSNFDLCDFYYQPDNAPDF